MTNKQPIPKFATEAEEAEWWYEQRDRLAEKAEAAMARSELKPRSLPSSPITGSSAAKVASEAPNGPDILKLSYVDMGTRQVPPPEAQLWRFMDLAKLVSMLDHNALYFPVLASLNDELEGSPPRPPQGSTDEDKLRVYDTWQYNRTVLFVNCWHQSDDESAAMWALYGNQGVAVRTTFGLLTKAVHQCPSANPPVPYLTVVGGMVDYLSPDKTSPPADVSNPIAYALRKLHWYEYEKEVRLIYHLHSNCEHFSRFPCAKQKGVWVSCCLPTAISAVVLAPFSPPFLEEAVRAVCSRFGLDLSLVQRSRIEQGVPSVWTFSDVSLGS